MAGNRDLDADIAETIFKWRPTSVGNDARGENAGEILTKTGKLPEGYTLPHIGKLHRGLFAPSYSGDLEEALMLAVRVGIKMDISEIDFTDYNFSENLARRCLECYTRKEQ